MENGVGPALPHLARRKKWGHWADDSVGGGKEVCVWRGEETEAKDTKSGTGGRPPDEQPCPNPLPRPLTAKLVRALAAESIA